MNEKILDFNKTVYELYQMDPGIADILAEIGFNDILKPGMIQTAGRFMTIKKGAGIKRIDIDIIKETFINKGYNIIE